jgi:hypothetical protein
VLTVTIGTKTSGRVAWLEAGAGASYARMRAAGCPAGGITDAGRTNAEQWALWRAYKAGRLHATAAYPGTSKHETGRALDLSGTALAWVRAHGVTYGWMHDRIKNELWHCEYEAGHDNHAYTGDDMTAQFEIDVRAEMAWQRGLLTRLDADLRGELAWLRGVVTPLDRDLRGDLLEKKGQLASITAAVERITVGGIDYGVLADALADRLATRMAD